ncbi:MAG: recombinase family protein [Flexilinea sp.]|nr:recombinase family protein [Flexilinea sp.]
MATYGYVRVSTAEQHIDRQMAALLAEGIPEKQIYIDRMSGKNFNRPQWKRLKRRLKRGDVLVVKSIDRLGRAYDDIAEEWRFITKEIGADIVPLDEKTLDTRSIDSLVEKLVKDIIFRVQSFSAENERTLILRRQAEGIAAAKARGVRFGRPELPRPKDFEAVADRWRTGQISARRAAQLLNVSHPTFLKWVRG